MAPCRVLDLKPLKVPTKRVVGCHHQLIRSIHKVDVKFAPVAKKLAHEKAKKTSGFFGGKGHDRLVFVLDLVFIARFEPEQFGEFPNLADEEAFVWHEIQGGRLIHRGPVCKTTLGASSPYLGIYFCRFSA